MHVYDSACPTLTSTNSGSFPSCTRPTFLGLQLRVACDNVSANALHGYRTLYYCPMFSLKLDGGVHTTLAITYN